MHPIVDQFTIAVNCCGYDRATGRHRFQHCIRHALEPRRMDIYIKACKHLRHIAVAFAQGDFAIPGFVHDMGEVPGTAIMKSRRDAITYTFAELPRGGEVRIHASDTAAVRAIHEFLAFQRGDHRAPGHVHQ